MFGMGGGRSRRPKVDDWPLVDQDVVELLLVGIANSRRHRLAFVCLSIGALHLNEHKHSADIGRLKPPAATHIPGIIVSITTSQYNAADDRFSVTGIVDETI